MKKLLSMAFIMVSLSSILSFRVLADTVTGNQNNQPVLPENASDVQPTATSATQQISSPAVNDESTTQTFVKGVAVGAAVGVIVGGVVVWFYKKKLS